MHAKKPARVCGFFRAVRHNLEDSKWVTSVTTPRRSTISVSLKTQLSRICLTAAFSIAYVTLSPVMLLKYAIDVYIVENLLLHETVADELVVVKPQCDLLFCLFWIT